MYTNKTTHCFIIICTYSVYIFVWFIGYSHEWMPEVRGGDDWREAGRCCWVYHGGDVVTSSLTCHILQILAVLRSKQGFCIYRWMRRRLAASVGVGVGARLGGQIMSFVIQICAPSSPFPTWRLGRFFFCFT